ncbi:hypothetical protein TNCV_1935781 [Trichonephila clavipes]|nr:hypothetical protein TNCV_1935781 [Trichonephila clavipes]
MMPFSMSPMQQFLRHRTLIGSYANHGGILPVTKPKRRAWGIFRRYPTTVNLIAFKRANASARRIRRQRDFWIQYISSITSSTTIQ